VSRGIGPLRGSSSSFRSPPCALEAAAQRRARRAPERRNRRAQALTLEHLTDFSAGAAEPEGQLTKREQQIVDGVVRGLRSKEIARHLNISEKTVKSHLNNIFQKLALEGRFALAVFDQSHTHPKT